MELAQRAGVEVLARRPAASRSPAAVRSTTSPTGRWRHTSRADQRALACRAPRSRCRRYFTVKASCNWARSAGLEAHRRPSTPSSSPPCAMPAAAAPCAVTSTGSSSSTKRSVSASCTVMSSTTPPPAAGPVDAPALEVRRQIDGVEDAGGERLADAAGLRSPRASRGGVRGVAQMVVGAHHHAGRAAGLDHAPRIGDVSASGFSHRTCLPALAAASVCGVCSSLVVRDVDRVDVARPAARRGSSSSCGMPLSPGIGACRAPRRRSSPRRPRRRSRGWRRSSIPGRSCSRRSGPSGPLRHAITPLLMRPPAPQTVADDEPRVADEGSPGPPPAGMMPQQDLARPARPGPRVDADGGQRRRVVLAPRRCRRSRPAAKSRPTLSPRSVSARAARRSPRCR